MALVKFTKDREGGVVASCQVLWTSVAMNRERAGVTRELVRIDLLSVSSRFEVVEDAVLVMDVMGEMSLYSTGIGFTQTGAKSG